MDNSSKLLGKNSKHTAIAWCFIPSEWSKVNNLKNGVVTKLIHIKEKRNLLVLREVDTRPYILLYFKILKPEKGDLEVSILKTSSPPYCHWSMVNPLEQQK